jgi:hypothetical protein
MSKNFIERLKSGELIPFDAAPAFDSDEEEKIIKVSTKDMNTKGKVIEPKVKAKKSVISPAMIRDGSFTIKQIIEMKPTKPALKEWLKIRVMELTASDSDSE